MTNRFYISKNYRNPYTASSKAKMDAERIATANGFKNVGLPSKTFESSIIGRLWTVLSTLLGLLRMPRNGVILLQHPSNNIDTILRKARKRNNKIIILIHDINALRNQGNNSSLDFIHLTDCVIVHTNKMKEYIHNMYPKVHIEVLKVFDYLDSQIPSHSQTHDYSVAFAGNIRKSMFIPKLASIPVLFKLFGIGGEELPKHQNLMYCGCFHPSILSQKLDADFGLVWDGTSIDTCDGVLGEYLKYICPHKLSMYLSSGIPIIIWKESAMNDFVKKNNIGIAVNSLRELPKIFSNLSIEKYSEIRSNAIRIGRQISDGYFLSTVLKKF